MKIRQFIWVAAILLGFASCEKESVKHSSSLQIVLRTEANGNTFMTPGTFMDSLGNNIQLETVRIYMSGIKLYPSNGGDPIELESTFLFDQSETNPSRMLSELPIGNYSAIEFRLGVDSLVNATTLPADYPDNHPLGIDANMHWSWSTGYIFFKYEGRNDSTYTGNFDQLLLYHVGLQQNERSKMFSRNFSVAQNSTNVLEFRVDLNKIFSAKGINARTEFDTQTMDNPVLATKMANLQIEALRWLE